MQYTRDTRAVLHLLNLIVDSLAASSICERPVCLGAHSSRSSRSFSKPQALHGLPERRRSAKLCFRSIQMRHQQVGIQDNSSTSHLGAGHAAMPAWMPQSLPQGPCLPPKNTTRGFLPRSLRFSWVDLEKHKVTELLLHGEDYNHNCNIAQARYDM